MNQAELLALLRSHRFAIDATAAAALAPQAAIVGIAVTERLELVFDTLASSRKAANLRANPRMAFVIGGWNEGDPRTVQYEGLADLPSGPELEMLKQAYSRRSRTGEANVDSLQRLQVRAAGHR